MRLKKETLEHYLLSEVANCANNIRGGIHSPLEVARQAARALGATRLLKDGVEVAMDA